MSRRLAPQRRTLDAMPSPVDDRPGLLLRDRFGHADEVVTVPPPLVPYPQFFDGEHEEADLAAALYPATGDVVANGFATRLADTLGVALLRYEQWNIDPASVVSFAALAFGEVGPAARGEGDA